MSSSYDELESLALKVLETWSGTPEELGATLHDATICPFTYPTAESRHEARLVRSAATRRLLACEGGAKLIQAEKKFLSR